MSKITFLHNIKVSGFIPNVESAQKYNLEKSQFISCYREFLLSSKTNKGISLDTMHPKSRNQFINLMLHFAGEPYYNNAHKRYGKCKKFIITKIKSAEFPSIEDVLKVKLTRAEFEEALPLGTFTRDKQYIELQTFYEKMDVAEARVISEIQSIMDIASLQNPFQNFFA